MNLLQEVLNETHMRAPKGIVYGPAGLGKAQPLDAKILTPNGYVAMGDLKVGDEVIGSNGKPCKILGIYPQGEKEIFRVTMLDGSSTECSDDHLWKTQTRMERQQGVTGSVRPLSTIRQTLKCGTHFNHAIPRVQPVQFCAGQDLPIHPWLLGMYLGDGHADTSVIITNPEEDIQTKIQKLLPDGDGWTLRDRISLSVSRKANHQPSTFMDTLRRLGLNQSRANTKFIPEMYLLSTIENRLELLRGLCDSDGFICGAGMVEYITVSEQLARNVRFLAKSLGADVTVKQKKPSYRYKGEQRDGQLAYKLLISVKNSLVPVSSKKHLDKWQSPTWSRTNSIRSVEPVGVKVCQCIKVDALDSLYVTDDFIVTHNTTFGAGTNHPILVDCENGASHVRCDRTPYLKDWDSIRMWLQMLATEDHPYETVVIDSIDWLLRRVEEKVAGVNGDGKSMGNTLNRSHGGYGNGKQVLRNYVYQYLLPTFDAIVNRGIAVLLLAHSSRQSITNIDGISFEKSTPEIHSDLMNTMVEWSDFVGAARMDNGQRQLILAETPQLLAKNRYNITEPVALDWNALLGAMNNTPPSNQGE